MRGAVVVLAKAPRPGAVKTRLVPPLSAEEAAGLYACMLDDVLEATAAAARALGLDAVLAVHPPGAARDLAGRAPPPFRAVAQRGPDLAARMAFAVAECAAGGAGPVLLRGSDSPALDPCRLEEALAALADADLAVCPDPDGGYSLVGLRRPVPGVFRHPMSTAAVLEHTLENARRLGLRAVRLAPGFDVDSVEDLRRLRHGRAGSGTDRCRRTLTFLDERRLWRHA